MDPELTAEMRAHLERAAANGDRDAKVVLGVHAGNEADIIRFLASRTEEFALEEAEVEAFLAEFEDDAV